ncbi:hypothetical protein OG777_10545 [Micromonospora peucetia]|uniref:hypothetical protein n=1 Tax=Micromonospora peucetia TaxID=47871 RepID=UPI00225294D5|nr:hypothetical protein [Micromonospora peucetia]MCX4387371.1 hypothetical protein [Micromonospora peucetia]
MKHLGVFSEMVAAEVVVVTFVLPDSRTVEDNGHEFIAPGDRLQAGTYIDPPHLFVGDDSEFERRLTGVAVSFTDSSGVCWRRENNQAPTRETGSLMHLREMIEFNIPPAEESRGESTRQTH